MSDLFNDVGYLTPEHYEYAEKQGITKTALTQRYYYCGFTLEEALTTPYKKKRQTELMKWRELALKNGISLKTFENRIYYQGWTYEAAATRPARKKRNTA